MFINFPADAHDHQLVINICKLTNVKFYFATEIRNSS